MSNQIGVGTRVLYQPKGGERQQAAIITGWNDQSQLASLAVFPASANYLISENGVEEGTADGTFQQLGTLSHVGITKQLVAQAGLERRREMSRKEGQNAETTDPKAATPEP